MDLSPYTPLYNAKELILKKVKSSLTKNDSEQSFQTVSIQLSSIDLVSLLPFIDHSQKILFCDRENQKQYLGIKFLKVLNSSFALEDAQEYILENPKLVVLGGQRFHLNSKASMEWSELGSHFYVLPQFVFITENNKTVLNINIEKSIFNNSTQSTKLLLDIESLFSFKGHSQRNLKLMKELEIPSKDQWVDQVNLAKEEFKNSAIEKIVLSRKVVFKSPNQIKPDDLYESLSFNRGEHFIFHMQWRRDRSFTSITPERLFKLENSKIVSDAIAGTRPRGANQQEDQVLEKELKGSMKEISEHRFVSKSVLEVLKSIGCTDASIDQNPEQVLKLKHVQHLYTKLTGHLHSKMTTHDLIDAFHPTPAVGGTPKLESQAWLKDNESYDRGFYAAPVGVITASGADFCVAIRSALIQGDRAHVFAGAGIVEQSDAESEWNETHSKMRNFDFSTTNKKSSQPKENINEQRSSH